MAKKILLVEDDVAIREIYSVALGRAGYELDTASDGLEAVEKGKTLSFDLILLDIMLPKMTGIDVLKTIRQDESKKATPIIMMTNLSHDATIKNAFELGAKGYILKVELTPSMIVNRIDAFFQGAYTFPNPTEVNS